MASLKTEQSCGHAWAWHIEGACQKCRIERLEAFARGIAGPKTTRVCGRDVVTCQSCETSLWSKTQHNHKSECLYVRAQEALKGEDHD